MLTFGVLAKMLHLSPEEDVVFTAIPMYHIQGGVAGVLTPFFSGVQVIVRKFSASQFWSQYIKYNVTVAQYLVEIIRYY
jgi:acyl-CoA synthetase (AMP-forming)/AMP-acid ligase II